VGRGKPPFEFAAATTPLPAAVPTAPSGRSRRFRVDVGTIVSAVALAQSLMLVSLGYWGSQRLVSSIGTSAHRANHDRTEDKVLAFLAKAESAVGAIGSAPSLSPRG
jgi:adenylate cyclase